MRRVAVSLGVVIALASATPGSANHPASDIAQYKVKASRNVLDPCGAGYPVVTVYPDDTAVPPATGNWLLYDRILDAINSWDNYTTCEGSGALGDTPHMYRSVSVSFSPDTTGETSPGNCSNGRPINGYSWKNTAAVEFKGGTWSSVGSFVNVGVTFLCFVANGSTADQFSTVIRLNRNVDNNHEAQAPTSTEIDSWGTLAHEFGHLLAGSSLHFNEGDTVACPGSLSNWDGSRSTMCNGTNAVPGTWNGRTIDSHDISAMFDHYN